MLFMSQVICTLRLASRDDAPLLAELVNYAGEGLPLYYWGKKAGPNETAWDVGRRRVTRETYQYTTMIEHNGNATGCLIAYENGSSPTSIPPGLPAIFVPIRELQSLAPNTWYVNVLAILPRFRGTGLGTRLLAYADETASGHGNRGLSLIVSDANRGARRLYERCGYQEVASRPMVKEGWANEGQNWLLLIKVLR
jgi:ribosomal protein S18 acetylase RimI-like enzyme